MQTIFHKAGDLILPALRHLLSLVICRRMPEPILILLRVLTCKGQKQLVKEVRRSWQRYPAILHRQAGLVFAALAAKAKASWSQLAMRTISGLGALPTISFEWGFSGPIIRRESRNRAS